MGKWIVEAYTPMGIMSFNPEHTTIESAEKHKTRLEKEQPGVHFSIVEKSLVKERNKAVFGE